MLGPRRIALLCALALLVLGGLSPPAAPAASAPQAGPRVLLAFLPAQRLPANLSPDQRKNAPSPGEQFLTNLARRRDLAIGILSATQGSFSNTQALLDITQGTRVSGATYDPTLPIDMTLVKTPVGGFFDGWPETVARAESAPATIDPGLLAGMVCNADRRDPKSKLCSRGDAAYIGLDDASLNRVALAEAENAGQQVADTGITGDRQNLEAIAAADTGGAIASVSLGSDATVAQRAQMRLRTHRFVVANFQGPTGNRQIDQVLRDRPANELVIVVQTPPDLHGSQLIGVGVAGLTGRGAVTSETTRRHGIVAGIDILPTVLRHLGIKTPDDVRGTPIKAEGARNVDSLNTLKKRLASLGRRRIPALQGMLLFWVGLMFALGAYGGWHRMRRRGLRIGALAVLWVPTTVLVTGYIGPGAAIAEMGILATSSFILGALTDRFVAWPRGPIVPAAVGLGVITIDLANKSSLIVQSLLGPNPRFGSRFFGIGNEMEAALSVLLFIGVAAALTGRARSRRNAAIFAGCGLALGVIIGSGRLGADVGGVITVGVGTAVGTLMMLPKRPSKKVIALALLSPLVALAALALLDIVTGANGHFTRSVLHANNQGLKDVFIRRYELAGNALIRGRMPAIVLAGALAVSFAYRNREWLYAPLRGDYAWRAALVASLAAGIGGSISNDSGPLLFVVAIFALGCATAYIQGDPRLADQAGGEELGGGLAPTEGAIEPRPAPRIEIPADGSPAPVGPPAGVS